MCPQFIAMAKSWGVCFLFAGYHSDNTVTNPYLRVGRTPFRYQYGHKFNMALSPARSHDLEFRTLPVWALNLDPINPLTPNHLENVVQWAL
jgi:hypothetical protein